MEKPADVELRGRGKRKGSLGRYIKICFEQQVVIVKEDEENFLLFFLTRKTPLIHFYFVLSPNKNKAKKGLNLITFPRITLNKMTDNEITVVIKNSIDGFT